MSKEKVLGIVRHVLTFGGGFVVAQGWAGGAEMEAIVAGLLAAAGVIWSVLDKN